MAKEIPDTSQDLIINLTLGTRVKLQSPDAFM